MILRSRLAIFVLLITLSACTTPKAALPAASAQPGPLPTRPPASTATLLPPTPTQLSIPNKLPSITPQPSATPGLVSLVYPAPKPLTSPAPWLIFPCGEAQANSAPTVANSDGTGCVPFPLPTGLAPDRSWISAASQRGSYVAFRVNIQPRTADGQTVSAPPNAAYRLQPNGLDDQLWIIKLPENRILRKIAQIDAAGWERIQQSWQQPTGKRNDGTDFVPLPLAVILDPASYRWSPNGRFLAYTGVDKDGVDLFVYDSLTDTIRRMSRGRQGAFFWSWAPDGKWIIYHDMASCTLVDGRCQMERGPHYFAVAFPKPEYQFEDSFAAGDIDWISKSRYILQDVPTQGQLSSHLVQVDLEDGSVTNLYDAPFISYTYVPKTYVSRQEMYLLNLAGDASQDRPAGIYNLYPPRQVDWLRPFHIAKYADYTIQWERTLEQFILSKDLTTDPPVQKEVFLASTQLIEPVPLGILGTSRLYLSPDAEWFTTRLRSGSWALYTKQGKLVKELGLALTTQSSPVVWGKDSSTFYFISSGKDCASSLGCVYRFSRDQEWQPILTGDLKGKPDSLQVIEP